eukprot:6024103-Pyramimonas_sp.AAC.1
MRPSKATPIAPRDLSVHPGCSLCFPSCIPSSPFPSALVGRAFEGAGGDTCLIATAAKKGRA